MAGGQAIKCVTLHDASALAIIGPFNSGSAAVLVPITNEAGVPVVSPASTYIGLMRGGAGAEPGEPDTYYPTGERTYFRIMPNDLVQADALATAMRDAGCRRVGAARMFGRVSRTAKLLASDGVAETGFTRRVSRSVAKRTTITVSTLDHRLRRPLQAL